MSEIPIYDKLKSQKLDFEERELAEWLLGEMGHNPDEAAHAFAAACSCIADLEAKLAEVEAVIAKHNAKMDAVPSLGKASPSMPAGLRFLAKWFDALYGDAGTGQDTVQQDLRRWADEYDTTMNDLHTFMLGHRKFVAEDGYCGMTDTINPLPEWMLAFNRLHEQAEAAKEARDAT